MADPNTPINMTFGQLCEYTEAARHSDPYRAPEDVAGEWLEENRITPEPSDTVTAAAEQAAREWIAKRRAEGGSIDFWAQSIAAELAWDSATDVLRPRFRTAFVDEVRRLLAAGGDEVGK